MTLPFISRALTLSLIALSVLLTSCGGGGGTVNDPFRPTRIVIFGDAFSDTTPNTRYTVNDSSTNNWALQIAASYGVSNIVSYAKGNARVTNATGAGGVAVNSLTTQVSGFSYQSGDLVIINAGFSDVIAEAAGTNQTTNASAAGTAFANLIRSMVTAGARHIAVANMYDLSKTPAAGIVTNLATLNGSRGALVVAFNDALKSNLGSATLTNVAEYVRLLDLEAYFNLVKAAPTSYSYTDATTIACNSNDTANGIGLGLNQINSGKPCTTGTLAQASYNSYVFADAVYPTPAFHRAWGVNAYNQITSRW